MKWHNGSGPSPRLCLFRAFLSVFVFQRWATGRAGLRTQTIKKPFFLEYQT